MADLPRFTILTAARLLDGSGGAALEDAAVLLDGPTIQAIGPRAEIRAPDGATVVTHGYGDATILPGLVDGHTHMCGIGDGTPGDDVVADGADIVLLRAAANARATLESGVTSVRENGALGQVAATLRDAIERGIVPGPRMVICGRAVTITGGHLHFFGGEADSPDGARQAVRQLLKEGADYLKIMASGGSTRSSQPHLPAFTVAELRAIVDEAHRRGKLTAAHAIPGAAIEDCLDAGVDMIIHCTMTEPDGQYAYRADLADRIAVAGAWVNPTLHDLRAWVWHFRDERERSGGRLGAGDEATSDRLLRMWDAKVDTVRRLKEAGVRLMAGSDSPWSRFAPGRGWLEADALVEAGLSPAAALIAMTSGSAESIGVGDVAGRLAPGRQADVLVVPGDPLADLAALGNPAAVWQAGRLVSRS